jgi:predicted SAM-dependent methyltransferase
MSKLIIGSGPGGQPQDDTVRIDIIPEWCDLQCDIKKGIPLKEPFDEINCEHVLEHIQLNEDFLKVMWELHRLLKPGGELYIEVPHKDGEAAYESIEHTRFFNNNTFKDFYDNPYAKEMNYPQFKVISCTNGERNGHKTLNLKLTK